MNLDSIDVLDSISLNWWQIGFILVVIFVIILFVFQYLKKKQKNIDNNNEYGSACFATRKELHKTFDKENLNNIQEYGFPIWFDKNLSYMLVDRQTPHWLFLGSTGSGKSLTSVKPQAAMIATAKKKKSVFFSDPKGELFGDTAKMFLDNGYEVLTLDFRNPTLSNKVNILEPVIDEWTTYFEKKKICQELEFKLKIAKEKLDKDQEDLKIIKNKFKREEIINDLKKQIKIMSDSQKGWTTFKNESMDAYGEACRLVVSISEMITSEENTKDPFFNASAGNLLAGLIFYFLERYEAGEITRDKITLNSISKFQTSTTEETNFQKFKRILAQTSYDFNSKLRLTNVVGANENTFKSITAVFGQKMSIFNDLNVANVTSSSDFDFDVLGKGVKTTKENEYKKIQLELTREGKNPTEEEINKLLKSRGLDKDGEFVKPVALYVIVRDEDESYNVLITLIVGLMYKCLVKLAVNSLKQRLPIDIVFMLDEFANCPPFPSIGQMVTVARSRGMMFQFYIQDYSQLDKIYGKEIANTIKGNAGLVYLKTTNYETAEAVSKRLGKKTIQSSSFSHGLGWKETFAGNTNTSLMGRELFTPDEIMGLEYKTIIFPIKKSNPIYRDTIPFFSFFKTNKKFYEGTVTRETYILSQLEEKKFTIEEDAGVDAPIKGLSNSEKKHARTMASKQVSSDATKSRDFNLLQPAIKHTKEILQSNFTSAEILEDSKNNRWYAKIITKYVISDDIYNQLQKINQNQSILAYEIITNTEENHTVIIIHIANVPQAMSQVISFQEAQNRNSSESSIIES